MAAGVFIGEQFAFEPPDETFLRVVAAGETELHCRAFGDVRHRRYLDARHARERNGNAVRAKALI